jgi:hypothetical protein
MAVTEKISSSPGPAAPLLSRTSPLTPHRRAHRPPESDSKLQSPSSPPFSQKECHLQGLAPSDRLQHQSSLSQTLSPDEEHEDSFPNFIRSKAEEYSKRIQKLQEDFLYPLKEDLAEWINRIMQNSDLTAENFIERLDNGVLILRMAKIIESQCSNNMFDNTESISRSTSGISSINGKSGNNNVHNVTPLNGKVKVSETCLC